MGTRDCGTHCARLAIRYLVDDLTRYDAKFERSTNERDDFALRVGVSVRYDAFSFNPSASRVGTGTVLCGID